MNSEPIKRASISATDSVGEIVERYESALAAGSANLVFNYFPDASSLQYVETVCELLRIRIEHDWSLGSRNVLEQILVELPELSRRPEIMTPVAYEDFRQARLHGVNTEPEWYARQWGIDTSQWLDEWAFTLSQLPGTRRHDESAAILTEPIKVDTHSARLDATADQFNNPHHFSTSSSVNFPKAGTQFAEFELLRELGRGAFSRVFLARQRDLANRCVVLKVTAMPLGESQRLAKLQHANIMPLYSIHQHQGLFALCMPWLGSATLKDLLDEFQRRPKQTSLSGLQADLVDQTLSRFNSSVTVDSSTAMVTKPGQPMDPAVPERQRVQGLRQQWQQRNYVDAILLIGLHIAQGLKHAHERGILHRDIKPANVLMSFDGEPVLLDFNLSREIQSTLVQSARGIGGTLPYMAPEHLRAMWLGEGAVGQTADIFSLGVVLYELLTGRLPHPVNQLTSDHLPLAVEQREQPIAAADTINKSVSPAVVAILAKCLAVEPTARYGTAAQLVEDIQCQLAHRPLKFAPNSSWLERSQKFFRRHPSLQRTSTLIGAAMIIIAALAIGVRHFAQVARQHQSLATWHQFQQAAHLAEASLLFPDGGTYSPGIDRAGQALALFDCGQQHWQQQPKFLALPLEIQRSMSEQVAFLDQLVAQVKHVTTKDQPAISLSALETKPNSKWTDPVVVASQAYLQRDFVQAIEELESAIESQPRRFALWFLLGKCYYEQREYRQADYGFAMASHIDPQSALSVLGRALCDYWMRQDDSAWEHLERASRIDPSIPAIYVNKALLRERQLRWPEALLEIDRALQLAPDTSRYIMIRSRLKRKKGDLAGADRDLGLVKNLEPRDPEDWIMRGLAHISDNPEAALADFRQAAKSPSQAIVARQNMAHVLSERLQRPQEALEVLSELLAEQPDFVLARAGRAVLYARQQQRESALADIRAFKSEELTPQIHYQISCALALLAVNDGSLVDEALHHLSLAVEPAYGGNLIGKDNDLLSLESEESFQLIKKGLGELRRWQAPPRKP